MKNLPKIELPKYRHTFVTGETIEFRPFTVKEQKILLLAKESGKDEDVVQAVRQIIENCTFGKLDLDTTPLFNIEDLFLRIRARSVSNLVELRYRVKDKQGNRTNETLTVSIDLDEVKMKTFDDHSNKVMITDNIGIKFAYPTVNMFAQSEQSDADQLISLIDYIYTEEDVFPKSELTREYLEELVNDLDPQMLKKISDTYLESMPRIHHTVTVKTKDGEEIELVYDNIVDFFT